MCVPPKRICGGFTAKSLKAAVWGKGHITVPGFGVRVEPGPSALCEPVEIVLGGTGWCLPFAYVGV